MAFAHVGNIGTALSTAANQANLVMTTSATVEVGNLAVLIVAVDNNITTDGDSTAVSSVFDSAGNLWSRAKGFSNGQGTAQTGADCSIWFSQLRIQLTSGGTITAIFETAASADAAAMTAHEFTVGAGKSVEVENTAGLANDGAAAGSLDAATASIECLRVRGIASESSSTTALTPTSTWNIFTQAVSGAGTSTDEMGVRGEYLISTGTGAASAPTNGAGAVDNASAYVAFKEVDDQIQLVGWAFNSAIDGANVTLSYSSDPQAGDVIYLWGGHTVQVGQSLGPLTGAWVEIANSIVGTVFQGGLWRRVADGTEGSTISCGGSGNAADACTYGAFILRGVDNTTPEDAGRTIATTTSGNVDPASITTVTANAWVLSMVVVNVNDNIPGTPLKYKNIIAHTGNDTTDTAIAGATRLIEAAGAENPPAFPNLLTTSRGLAITQAVRPGSDVQTLVPPLFTNTNTFYTQVITTGSVALTPSLFTNTNTFFTQVITTGVVNLTPDLFANSNTFYTQVITTGAVELTPDLFTNANAFYTQVVSTDAVALTPDLFTDGDTFFTPAITTGVVDLAPDLFADGDTFYTQVITTGVGDLAPDLFTNTNTFFTQAVTTGVVDLAPDLFANANTFFTQVITTDAVALTPDLFANSNTFFTQVITTGVVDLAPDLFTNAHTFFTQVITTEGVVALTPDLFVNSNTFYTQVITTGAQAPIVHVGGWRSAVPLFIGPTVRNAKAKGAIVSARASLIAGRARGNAAVAGLSMVRGTAVISFPVRGDAVVNGRAIEHLHMVLRNGIASGEQNLSDEEFFIVVNAA